MPTLDEQIQYGISQFKNLDNIVDVQVEKPSDLINLQIGYEPSVVFVLTVRTYVSVTLVTIKFVVPISVIMTTGLTNIPENMIMGLAFNLALRPIDNSIQDHSYNDNLTDTALTIYIDPTPDTLYPDLLRPIELRGVNIHPYQGGPDYDNLISLIKQQPHVINVVGNIVVDPKLKPNYENFLAFSIETDIPLKNALASSDKPSVHTTTLSCMVIVNIKEINLTDTLLRQINERIEEYQYQLR